jgi:hypothetical protein
MPLAYKKAKELLSKSTYIIKEKIILGTNNSEYHVVTRKPENGKILNHTENIQSIRGALNNIVSTIEATLRVINIETNVKADIYISRKYEESRIIVPIVYTDDTVVEVELTITLV